MGRRSTVLPAARTLLVVQSVENLLQLVHPGDDHADGEDAQLVEQTEGVHVAGKERVLVVPLDLERYTALAKVHLVSDGLNDLLADQPADLGRILAPAAPVSHQTLHAHAGQEMIEPIRNPRLPPAPCLDLAAQQPESVQAVDDVLQFARTIGSQDGAGVTPLL